MKKILTSGLLTIILIISIHLQGFATGDPVNPRGTAITGRVTDKSSDKPMEYVNVAVFKASDSSLVTGTITDPEGKFRVENIELGNYYLRLTFLGFENMYSQNIAVTSRTVVDLGEIKMSATSSELEGVSVTGERTRVEYQIDKRVINVGQDVIAKGGTAVNALENTPSVQVDAQGNLTLRGSSDYVVLVDGKPSAVKGSDALKQISATTIKQIEVITNPSAKYEADGKAGIINVILKKDKLQGLNGNANISLATTDKYSGNATINYRKNKVNVFGGIDWARNKYIGDLNIHNISYLQSGTQHIEESVEQYNHNDNLNGRIGMDYDPNSANSFSLSASYGKQGYDNGAGATYHFYTEPDQVKYYFRSNSDMDVTGNVPAFSADYTHRFAENHTLFISTTWSAWDGADNNLVSEYATDQNYVDQQLNSSMKYRKDNYNYQYRLNVDYKRPVGKSTLEAGAQYRYEYREDQLLYHNFNTTDNTWILNQLYTYNLDYNNDIFSGYATFSGQTIWGIGYMAGLRTELFTREISFSNESAPYDYDKFLLYPSLHLSKTINNKHQFQASYSRRINRPLPWLLNKTPGYIDPKNIFKGSPYLEPEYTDSYELNYRSTFDLVTASIQTYFRNTTNCFNTTRTLQEDGIMVHELINADRQQSYGMELGLDFNVAKWWQISTGGNLYHYNLSVTNTGGDSKSEINTWDARVISNISLKWGTRFQAVGYMTGPRLDAQGKMDGFYVVNLGVSQSLMKGKVNFGLSAENLLDSVNFDYHASGSNYDNTYAISAEGFSLVFTASYSFNNFTNKQRGRSDDANFRGGGAF